MGDVTSGQLIVHQCPPEQARYFQAFIDDHYLSLNWGGMESNPKDNQLGLGEVYGGETGVGMVYDSNLPAEAPGSAYMMWTDPKHEFLGSIEMYTPELGVFSSDCDANGNVVLTQQELMELIDAQPEDYSMAQFREVLGKALGKPWRDALSDLPTAATPARVTAIYEEDED